MTFNKEQFLSSISERMEQRKIAALPQIRSALAVAPIMEKLTTGNEQWDRYLTYLQGYIGQAEAARVSAQKKLNDPGLWDTEKMTKLKCDIIVADAMIEAFCAAMALPTSLINDAENAREILARFENDSAGQTES